MKVLVIGTYHTNRTIVRQEAELLIALFKQGVDLTIMCLANKGYAINFANAGIPIIDFAPSGKLNFKAIRFVKKQIKNKGYTIVHCFNNKAIGVTNWAAIGLPVKVIAYRGAGGVSKWDPTYLLTILHPRIDVIHCLSAAVKKSFDNQFIFKKPPLAIIHKGQDLQWFNNVRPTNKQAYGIPKDRFLVTCLAHVRKVKGLEYFIRACAKIPSEIPIDFAAIGNKTDHKKFLTLANSLGVSNRVHLLGYESDSLGFIKMSQLIVQPTIGIEGLGRSLMEAMCLNVPVIATKSGGPEELIEHNKSGLLVNKKDSLALANAIIDLYKNSEKRAYLSNNARIRIEQNFSMSTYVNDVLSLYTALSNEK